eukprot:1549624-Amphidinium_carterae.1
MARTFEGLAPGLSTTAYRQLKLDGQSQKEDRKAALNAALRGVWDEERAHSAFKLATFVSDVGRKWKTLSTLSSTARIGTRKDVKPACLRIPR